MKDILLSVIIPTWRRSKSLNNLLLSARGLIPVEFEWEIIIVDNDIDGSSKQVIAGLGEQTDIIMRYVKEDSPGLHNARHRGAREARGQILAYLDDDVLLSPSWLEGARLIMEGKANAIAGQILPKWESPPPDWLIYMMRENKFGYLTLLDLGWAVREVDPAYVWGANFFIEKRLVFELGGFHPDSLPPDLLRYRGDGETGLMNKFRQAGYSAWYDPVATVFHVIPSERITLEYQMKRAFVQGISDSYSEIRAGRNPRIEVSKQKSRKSIKEFLLQTIKKTQRENDVMVSDEIKRILEILQESYLNGKTYHVDQIRRFPELLEYILRETYL